jgi:hypothetical protein
MKKAILAATLALLATGCTTYQTVSPVDPVDSVAVMHAGQSTLLCVIDNPVTGMAFVDALRDALTRRGFDVRMLPPGAPAAACPLAAVYVANRQTFWLPFLSTAEITIYRNGDRVGKAVYDAMRSAGGLNFSNLVSPAAKIEELVDRLFPGLRPMPSAGAAQPAITAPAGVAPA